MLNFCKITRQLDSEGLPKKVQILKFQKVFPRKLSPIVMSKLQDNGEPFS